MILAATDSFRALTNYMNHPLAMRGGGLMLLAGLSLVGFWVAMTYWDNYRQKIALAKQTPAALFLELCRIHNLNRDQIHILQACTQDQHELPILFVDPSLLETFAKSNPNYTANALLLRDTLFGHHMNQMA